MENTHYVLRKRVRGEMRDRQLYLYLSIFRTAHFCECFIKLHHVVFIVMHCCKSGSFYLQRHSQLEQAAETVSIGKRFRFYAEGMPPIGFRYKSTNTLSSFNQALVAQLGYRFAHN